MSEQNPKTLRQIITTTRSQEHKGIIVMPDGRQESAVALSFNPMAVAEIEQFHRTVLMGIQDFAVRRELCAEVDFSKAVANQNGIHIHCSDAFQVALEKARVRAVFKILDYKHA